MTINKKNIVGQQPHEIAYGDMLDVAGNRRDLYEKFTDLETCTINYREVTMVIYRYTYLQQPFAMYELVPCNQLSISDLRLEETGFSTLNIATLLMEMAAEWELRQEEFNYYAKKLKIRTMEAATADRIDPEHWKELSWEEKINEVKTFMEAVIERDCANEALDIPFHTYNINMIDLLKRQMIPYFNSNGLQEVHAYIPSDSFHYIAMEYQGWHH